MAKLGLRMAGSFGVPNTARVGRNMGASMARHGGIRGPFTHMNLYGGGSMAMKSRSQYGFPAGRAIFRAGKGFLKEVASEGRMTQLKRLVARGKGPFSGARFSEGGNLVMGSTIGAGAEKVIRPWLKMGKTVKHPPTSSMASRVKSKVNTAVNPSAPAAKPRRKVQGSVGKQRPAIKRQTIAQRNEAIYQKKQAARYGIDPTESDIADFAMRKRIGTSKRAEESYMAAKEVPRPGELPKKVTTGASLGARANQIRNPKRIQKYIRRAGYAIGALGTVSAVSSEGESGTGMMAMGGLLIAGGLGKGRTVSRAKIAALKMGRAWERRGVKMAAEAAAKKAAAAVV